jgi:hypothetical protein
VQLSTGVLGEINENNKSHDKEQVSSFTLKDFVKQTIPKMDIVFIAMQSYV